MLKLAHRLLVARSFARLFHFLSLFLSQSLFPQGLSLIVLDPREESTDQQTEEVEKKIETDTL